MVKPRMRGRRAHARRVRRSLACRTQNLLVASARRLRMSGDGADGPGPGRTLGRGYPRERRVVVVRAPLLAAALRHRIRPRVGGERGGFWVAISNAAVALALSSSRVLRSAYHLA